MNRPGRTSRLWLPLIACGAALLAPAQAAWAQGDRSIYFGDLGQAVVAILTFLVLLFVLGRWVWKPIVKQLQRREEAIQQTIADAEKRQAEAEELLTDYRQRLDQADEDARKVLTEAREQAEQERRDLLEAARAESQRHAEAVREELEQAKQQALRELRDVTADVAADLAERIVRRDLSEEDHNRLIDESLERIRKRGVWRP